MNRPIERDPAKRLENNAHIARAMCLKKWANVMLAGAREIRRLRAKLERSTDKEAAA